MTDDDKTKKRKLIIAIILAVVVVLGFTGIYFVFWRQKGGVNRVNPIYPLRFANGNNTNYGNFGYLTRRR